MESFAHINENDDDDTYKIFRYFSGPAEHSDRVEPPNKRTKLDDQNWLPIDNITKIPGIEPIEEPIAMKLEYSTTSFNDTYSGDMGKNSSSESQSYFTSSLQEIGDVQRSVINIIKGAPETPVISTDTVSSYEEKSTTIVKELTPMVFRNYILYPPADGIVPKPTMKRLPGCKTLRIAGLPMSMSNEMLKEVFGECGNICNFSRKTKQKGAFRVTYSCESSIDRVLEFNGYTLVFNRDKKVLEGKIQVEFISVLPKNQQGSSQTVVSQKDKVKEEPILMEPQCGPSNALLKPTYLEFSIENAANLMKKMHGYNIVLASNQFIRWIEQGECNENNCICFLHLLNSMRSAALKLVKDTAKLEVNLRQKKDSLVDKYNGIPDTYFAEILKVFNVACSQTVLNSFTPKMRKRILEWRQNVVNVSKSTSLEWFSHSDLPDQSKTTAQVLQAKQLIEHKIKLQQLQAENKNLRNELKLAQEKSNGQITHMLDETEGKNPQTKNIENDNDGDEVINIVDKEAWLIAMIGTFLNFHRFGESIGSICQYLLKFDPTVTSQNIECLIRKLPTVFKEESISAGHHVKRKWTVWGI